MPEAYDFLVAGSGIVTPARAEAIGSAAPQITALQDTQMAEFIHWLNGEWVNAAHGGNPNVVLPSSMTGWSYMKKTAGFILYRHNTLSANVAAAAASFALTSAANWDSTGRSVLETTRGALDFVDHESKASNTLTVSTADGAETVSIRHVSGNRVHKLYPVASDFSRVHQLWVNQVPFGEAKLSMQFPLGRTFALHGPYFFFPRGMAEADVSYLYEKAPTEIVDLNKTTNIPRRFQRWAIYMTLHHVFMIRRKRGDTLPCLQMAELELQKAINADSVSSTSTRIRLA